MDPTVQVAFVSIFATFITTLGVVAVAVINNRRERTGAAIAGVEAGLDEKDVLERMLALIADVARKQVMIDGLKSQVRLLIEENQKLRDELTERDDTR